MQLENITFVSSFSPAPVGRFRWSNTVESNGSRGSLAGMRTERRLESVVSIAALGGGVWLGAGAEQGRVGDIDGRVVSPLTLFGLWRPFDRAVFSVTTSSRRVRLDGVPDHQATVTFRDSIYNDTTGTFEYFDVPSTVPIGGTRFGDSSGVSGRDVRWTEIEARLAWASSRVAFDARVGLRPRIAGFAASSWGRVTTTFVLAPRLALVAGAGSQAARSSGLAGRAPFVSLGLRLAPAALVRPRPPAHVRPVASEFRVLAADSGHYRVVVHATSARTLELSGDFDGWQPVSLVQTAPDEWEATLALGPGTYRVNMRVNGDRWTAPPGLPTAADEFNGTVGLLVIR